MVSVGVAPAGLLSEANGAGRTIIVQHAHEKRSRGLVQLFKLRNADKQDRVREYTDAATCLRSGMDCGRREGQATGVLL